MHPPTTEQGVMQIARQCTWAWPLVYLVVCLATATSLALPATPSSSHDSVCSVASYGAVCDNQTDDSAALQRVLDDPTCAVVQVASPRHCVSKALNISLMSGRTLQIDRGAALVVWRDVLTYNLSHKTYSFLSATHVGDNDWEGPLLTDFTLNGGGAILGGGAMWWPYLKNISRPRTLLIPNGRNLHISNLTFVDSPSYNMGIRANGVVIEYMNISSGASRCGGYYDAPNTDGFNIGGSNITVRYSTVHNGDDCIPVTTYNSTVGTSNVHVHDVACHCGTNGAVIYNQGGVVENITFDRISVHGTNQGLGVKIANSKSNATSGVVRNVTWQNMRITSPRYAAMYTNVFDEDASGCRYPSNPERGPGWLTVRDVRVENVTAQLAVAGQPAACFLLSPGSPAAGWTFANVTVTGTNGKPAAPYQCHNMVNITSQRSDSPVPCGGGGAGGAPRGKHAQEVKLR